MDILKNFKPLTVEQQKRALIYLDAFCQMAEKQKENGYAESVLESTAFYDAAVCDGHCLWDECADLLRDAGVAKTDISQIDWDAE